MVEDTVPKGSLSSWNKILNGIKRMSFFRSPSPLNINGKKKTHTFFGGIVSIFVVTFLLFQGTQYCVDMFNRKNPQFYQINEIEDSPSLIQLNRTNNFFLAITITKDNTPFNLSEASPFDLKGYSSHYSRNREGSRVLSRYSILWAPCKKSDFPHELFGDVFTINSLQYGFCLDAVNYTNPTDGSCPDNILKEHSDCIGPANLNLQGSYFSERFEFFQFKVYTCNEDSDPSARYLKCNVTFSEQDMEKSEYKVNIYFTNTRIDPIAYNTPNNSLIDTVYWVVSPQIKQFTDIFLDKITVQNYDHYLSRYSHRNQSFYTIPLDSMREMQVSRLGASIPLVESNIRRSIRNVVMVRKYTKLGNVMSKLGGFAKALMFIATFLVLSYMRYKYLMTVSNELYDFKSNANIFSSTPNHKRKKNMYQKAKAGGSSSGSSSRGELSQQKDCAVANYFKNFKKEPLKYDEMSYFTYLIKKWCCLKKRTQEELAEKARKLALEDLDIINIVKKANDIEKIKFLILNPNQRYIFDSYEKPLILLNHRREVHLDTFSNNVRMEIEKMRYEKLASGGTKEEEEKEEKRYIEREIRQQVLTAREQYDSLSKYGRLYKAYRYLKDDLDPSRARQNQRLLALLNHELLEAFERIDELIGKNHDPIKFEKIIKQLISHGH